MSQVYVTLVALYSKEAHIWSPWCLREPQIVHIFLSPHLQEPRGLIRLVGLDERQCSPSMIVLELVSTLACSGPVIYVAVEIS